MTTQDDDTRSVIEAYAAAWSAGDLGALVALYHDDLVLHWFGANPLAGQHAGKATALSALAHATARSGRRLLGVDHILVGGDRAALEVRERFERDGRSAEVRRVLHFRIAESKLRECWVYDQDAGLIDNFLA